ncbi:M28 family peptidase [Entomospira culicis]|uniref:Zn-dependent exopeptidase M28 n=1 Tax=Entomospira culicis TaxID=2719989 RepID=A0A968KVY9_9SPIO|nr:M28 family peptidase [Entomospira culicis]NIZ18401.1 Zn-dependent exopeptidase M28 [Entomospira culicis]NIZ68617.1 Zn-dependent exopeptidase M28 [Entomospira culicis]WDI37217.1 M28 family peptidase [Entomospira culicis]WDI38845.1 M28 family peptidase [Entomospira culicis]
MKSDLPAELMKDMREFSQSEDRFEYLRRWLMRCGIRGKKIELLGRRHLLVRFEGAYDPRRVTKIFVAHYDKVPHSPGGNDNGAAVFQLLAHAGRLAHERDHGQVQILFTDGEEILNGPISSQGAFQLARFFKSRGLEHTQFYVFDMCGIGDTIAIGGAGSLLLDQSLKQRLIGKDFYDEAYQAINNGASILRAFQGRPADWIYALFSDDLGFLLNGYPAVYFSVLPACEAALAHSNWHEVVKNERAMQALEKGYLSEEFRKLIYPLLPASWRTWHTPEDSVEALERRAFLVMEEFLHFLTYSLV